MGAHLPEASSRGGGRLIPNVRDCSTPHVPAFRLENNLPDSASVPHCALHSEGRHASTRTAARVQLCFHSRSQAFQRKLEYFHAREQSSRQRECAALRAPLRGEEREHEDRREGAQLQQLPPPHGFFSPGSLPGYSPRDGSNWSRSHRGPEFHRGPTCSSLPGATTPREFGARKWTGARPARQRRPRLCASGISGAALGPAPILCAFLLCTLSGPNPDPAANIQYVSPLPPSEGEAWAAWRSVGA